MTVVVWGDDSQKWLELGPVLGEDVILTQCNGLPLEVLAHCQRLSPCVLVVDDSFLDQIDSDTFYRTVDLGGRFACWSKWKSTVCPQVSTCSAWAAPDT